MTRGLQSHLGIQQYTIPDHLSIQPPTVLVKTPIDTRVSCSWADCLSTFTRDSDLKRHVQSVHLLSSYLCPVAICPKSRGLGYSRPDKLKEHMRKKHLAPCVPAQITTQVGILPHGFAPVLQQRQSQYQIRGITRRTGPEWAINSIPL